MLSNLFSGLLISASLFAVSARAQMPNFAPPPGERMDSSVAIDRALKSSSLTYDGKPFHALLEIGAGGPYSGSVEVWWQSAAKYHLVTTSPTFSQTKTVTDGHVQEDDHGDYYPRWLEDFVLALMDPLPMANNFRGGAVLIGSRSSCMSRDDRPGGITDQTTWGQVCFSGSEPRLSSTHTFNHSMDFQDWKSFGKKQIARTYQTEVLDYKPVVARLTKLEELKKPDDAMFAVASATPAAAAIQTAFVSTRKEESLIETAPQIQWPTVREGRTDGYMIVYARTDRTGQVREAAKHNSDQPGLESFGMEQALRYKFKPLLVNGVAQQMEMPLVLHFSTTLADPLPVLSVAEMKKQMSGCELGTLPPGTPKGTIVTIRLSVNEQGKLTGEGPVGNVAGSGWLGATAGLRTCRFAPLVVNGKATYYKGDVEIVAP